MKNEKIVGNIRKIAKEKGISIAEIERKYNWSSGLISRWAKTSPSVDKIVDVIHYLGVRYEDILGELYAEDYESEFSGADVIKYENVVDKLILYTKKGKLAWLICGDSFRNDEVQELLVQYKIFVNPFEEGYFLIMLAEDTIRMGVLTSLDSPIMYVDDVEQEKLLILLKEISENEYECQNRRKADNLIERFIEHEFL